MQNTLSRTLRSAIALLVASATFNVGQTIAQATPSDEGRVGPLKCGAGVQIHCGLEEIVSCETSTLRSLGDVAAGRVHSFFSMIDCKTTGTRNLYKD